MDFTAKRASALSIIMEFLELDLSHEAISYFRHSTREVPDDLYLMAAEHLLKSRRIGKRANLVALFHDSVDACTPEWNRKKEEQLSARALEGPQEEMISYEEHCRRHGKDPSKKPWEQLA
jgi:hypothetical protein